MGDETKKQAFEVGSGRVPVGPGKDAPLPTSFNPMVIDFGHYAGRSVEELAEVDPDYLRWLARHPSGARYRAEIERVLGPLPMIRY